MAPEDFEITETDEAGHVIATYVSSPTDTKGISRLDIIVSHSSGFGPARPLLTAARSGLRPRGHGRDC